MSTDIHTLPRVLLAMLVLALCGCDGSVSVRGRVTTGEGEAIAGAELRLAESGDGLDFEVTTDADGCFAVGGMVSPGVRDYRLTINAEGFRSLEETFRNSEEHAILVSLSAEQVDAEGTMQRLKSYPEPPELEICAW